MNTNEFRLKAMQKMKGFYFPILMFIVFLCLTTACGSDDENDSDMDGDIDSEFESDIEAEESAENQNEIDIENECVLEDDDEDVDIADGDELEMEYEFEPEAEDDKEDEPMRCNGFAELCNRPYNAIAYATTHNSMSNDDDGWIAPNQVHNIHQQLTDGVRGFMLDSYIYEGEPWLCHGDCRYGKKLLSEALGEMRAFLDEHPNEVMTIIFESYISAEEANTAFSESGLIDYVYKPDAESDSGWPTLQEMIEKNSKMVVFTAPWDTSAPDWYLDEWQYCWETEWHITKFEDFDCSVNRGALDNDVFILNHFMYGGFDYPSESLSALANANPFLYERAAGCLEQTGKMPNFITVNHYSTGDVFEAVNQLNGVE